MLFARAWDFIRGSPDLDHLPPDDRPEIALAGRSNVGKSTLINALVGQNHLARTSNTPGRTQELNFFAPPISQAKLYLVDMPGYGFAERRRKRSRPGPRSCAAIWRPPLAAARVPADRRATRPEGPTSRSSRCSTPPPSPIRSC